MEGRREMGPGGRREWDQGSKLNRVMKQAGQVGGHDKLKDLQRKGRDCRTGIVIGLIR